MIDPITAPMAGKPGGSAATVMQVLPSLVTGGVERGTVDVSAALIDGGWRSIVVSAGGPMVREVERAGAIHITLPVHSKNPLTMRANIRRLMREIESRDVDIIHARSRAPAWSARAAAGRTGREFVTTWHGTYPAHNIAKRAYNRIMGTGNRVIAISEFIGDMIGSTYGVPAQRIRVIPRGIDPDIFSPRLVSSDRIVEQSRRWRLPDGHPVIMLPGRLTRWKGQAVLLRAVAAMGRTDICCLLVGADQGRTRYVEELEALADKLGIAPQVRIVGHCDDMAAAYMLADVVVSASVEPEAFGRVAVEAQAMGRPVIATDHGGARETILDGVTGWLVPPDDADALARSLDAALCLDAADRDAMSPVAIAHVLEHFTKAHMCAATLGVYRELLARAAHAE